MMIKNCIWIVLLKSLAVFLPNNLHAQGLYIGPSANLVANGNVSIVLNNTGLINNGNFDAGNSTVRVTGDLTTGQSVLGGSSLTSFNHVTINRIGNVVLNSDININGTITMIRGNLQLNNHMLDLTATGTITGESDSSRITGVTGGVVRKTAKLYAPNQINPGNIGVQITSNVNLGPTVITRRHMPQTMSNGVSGIERYFSIQPTRNYGLSATLLFYYLNAELAGANENSLTLWSRADLGNYWLPSGRDSINETHKYVVKTGIDHFTDVTLAPGSTEQLLRINNNIVAGTGASPGNEQNAASIYPNPAKQQFVIRLISSIEKEYVISVYDHNGRLVESKKAGGRKGVNYIHWNMSSYANGAYLIVFENESFNSIQVIKQ